MVDLASGDCLTLSILKRRALRLLDGSTTHITGGAGAGRTSEPTAARCYMDGEQSG